MTEPTVEQALREIEERHQRYTTLAHCRLCRDRWPCDAIKLVRAVRIAGANYANPLARDKAVLAALRGKE